MLDWGQRALSIAQAGALVSGAQRSSVGLESTESTEELSGADADLLRVPVPWLRAVAVRSALLIQDTRVIARRLFVDVVDQRRAP